MSDIGVPARHAAAKPMGRAAWVSESWYLRRTLHFVFCVSFLGGSPASPDAFKGLNLSSLSLVYVLYLSSCTIRSLGFKMFEFKAAYF